VSTETDLRLDDGRTLHVYDILLPDRAMATVAMSEPAPYGAAGLDWSAGMAAAQTEEIGATVAGRTSLEQYLSSHEFDPDVFTAADQAALMGDWALAGPDRRSGRGGQPGPLPG
jgi:hypothetical protein